MGDSGCDAADTHMDTRGQCGDGGCSAGDTHMDTRTAIWQNIKHRQFDGPNKHVRGTLQNWTVRSTPSSSITRHGESQDSSVDIATTLRYGRTRDRVPVQGGNFRDRPDRSRGPPSLLYNGYCFFAEGKSAGACRSIFTPTKRRGSGKSTAIPLFLFGSSLPVLW